MCDHAYENVMTLKKLEIRNFRSYSHLSFYPTFKSLIVGNNGAGKTNLLEAISLLIHGRSFRAHECESFVRKGEKSTYIEAELFKEGKTSLVRFCTDPFGKKQLFFNGKRTTRDYIKKNFPLVVFSSESLSLLKDSADSRRWWLDYWLNVRGETLFVKDFRKALLQKNKLLKQIQKGLVSKIQNQGLLESLHSVFLERNVALRGVRKKALEDLSFFLQKSGSFIFKGREEGKNLFAIKYREKSMPSQAEEDKPCPLTKETEAGLSLYGAHRDDFQVFFNGWDSRFFCSQGQQRCLVLALKIAQILWLQHMQKRSCILLLDDVFSEIDKHRVLNLLHLLNEVPSQAILTSTKQPSALNKKQFQVFRLIEGDLRKEAISERRPQSIGKDRYPLG